MIVEVLETACKYLVLDETTPHDRPSEFYDDVNLTEEQNKAFKNFKKEEKFPEPS